MVGSAFDVDHMGVSINMWDIYGLWNIYGTSMGKYMEII
jgi:hypothetical protein